MRTDGKDDGTFCLFFSLTFCTYSQLHLLNSSFHIMKQLQSFPREELVTFVPGIQLIAQSRRRSRPVTLSLSLPLSLFDGRITRMANWTRTRKRKGKDRKRCSERNERDENHSIIVIIKNQHQAFNQALIVQSIVFLSLFLSSSWDFTANRKKIYRRGGRRRVKFV